MLVVMAVVVGVRVTLTCEKENLSTRIQHLEIDHFHILLLCYLPSVSGSLGLPFSVSHPQTAQFCDCDAPRSNQQENREHVE